MRISDWSSDVCSSDLGGRATLTILQPVKAEAKHVGRIDLEHLAALHVLGPVRGGHSDRPILALNRGPGFHLRMERFPGVILRAPPLGHRRRIGPEGETFFRREVEETGRASCRERVCLYV